MSLLLSPSVLTLILALQLIHTLQAMLYSENRRVINIKMFTSSHQNMRRSCAAFSNVNLYTSSKLEVEKDYSFASGVFSVKAEVEKPIWEQHILDTINMMYDKSTKSFYFNILSSLSYEKLQREHLYYGDSSFFLSYCIKNFSREVRLDHSYDLYEFTISALKG